MTPHPEVDGPTTFVDRFEKQTVFSRFHHELVFPGKKECFIRPAAGRIEERLGRLEEKRDRLRVIPNLAMGQSTKSAGRVFHHLPTEWRQLGADVCHRGVTG